MSGARRNNQSGMAMVTAIVLALIVSVTAAVVLSLTMRRFELSAMRTDRAVAGITAEAGFQYAFARLDLDAGFPALVQARRTGFAAATTPVDKDEPDAEYIVSCHDEPDDREDQLAPEIHMGDKHLRVRIRFFTPADLTHASVQGTPLETLLATRPYRVKAFSFFGTGEEWE